MTDAYENGNPQPEGQTIDNVGQDEGQNVEENSNQTWEEQAKYFQSEKDKLANENQNLKKYEAIGNLLKARPDIANTVATMVQGGNNGQPVGPQRIELDKDDFMSFAAKNPSEYGVEGAVKMWRAVMNEGQGTVTADNPLDNVRQTQETPTPGGILQGQQPQAKSGKDEMWDSIVGAGSRTNVLK
jgi:hypothetical protein